MAANRSREAQTYNRCFEEKVERFFKENPTLFFYVIYSVYEWCTENMKAEVVLNTTQRNVFKNIKRCIDFCKSSYYTESRAVCE